VQNDPAAEKKEINHSDVNVGIHDQGEAEILEVPDDQRNPGDDHDDYAGHNEDGHDDHVDENDFLHQELDVFRCRSCRYSCTEREDGTSKVCHGWRHRQDRFRGNVTRLDNREDRWRDHETGLNGE
jgi:hypothetical protein